jgi:hypothetical protein
MKRGSAFIQRGKNFEVFMINFLSLRGNVVADHSLQRFCFCSLVLSYRVKQAAKRQAKQCTALFCATPTH